MSNDVKFRDYQLDAIKSIFDEFGIEPAGPPTDQIVAHCSGNRSWEDSDNGGTGESVADRQGDDDKPPVRDKPASTSPTQFDLF